MSDAKDRILEVLQHNGGWMTFSEIREAAKLVSLAFVADALQDFVASQVVEIQDDKRKGKCWKAIFEREV